MLISKDKLNNSTSTLLMRLNIFTRNIINNQHFSHMWLICLIVILLENQNELWLKQLSSSPCSSLSLHLLLPINTCWNHYYIPFEYLWFSYQRQKCGNNMKLTFLLYIVYFISHQILPILSSKYLICGFFIISTSYSFLWSTSLNLVTMIEKFVYQWSSIPPA